MENEQQTNTELISDIKTDLGIKHDKRDDDIECCVSAAIKRMQMIGVEKVDSTDPVTKQAIKLYARHWYNFQGEAERYGLAFEALGNAMALSGDYREAENNE